MAFRLRTGDDWETREKNLAGKCVPYFFLPNEKPRFADH